MAIHHRKLLHRQDPNQNSTCYDCGPTCPQNCTYPEIYWQPLPPPLPPPSATVTTHISPYVIIILALLGSAFLFIIYYLIMVRCSTRLRRPPPTQLLGQADDFHDEDHGFEVDHPIWYITTIGLQSSVINSINVVKYKKDDNLIDGTDCSVCLSEFRDDESLRLLPKCNHAFHISCIDTWLRSHTNCPLCRAGILSNSFRAVLSPGDRSFSHEIGSNRHTQIDNLDNDGELGGTHVPESEICEEIEDTKTEYESVTAERRSSSMDSVAVAGITHTEFEGGSSDSTVNFMTTDRGGGDSRT